MDRRVMMGGVSKYRTARPASRFHVPASTTYVTMGAREGEGEGEGILYYLTWLRMTRVLSALTIRSWFHGQLPPYDTF